MYFSGLDGGYWGAVGVRGALREKIKKQESQEKDLKKKIKKNTSPIIKSPSIRVENILSRVTIKAVLENENSVNIAKSILNEILHIIASPGNVRSPSVKSSGGTGEFGDKETKLLDREKISEKEETLRVESKHEISREILESAKNQEQEPHELDDVITEFLPSEDGNIYDFVHEDFFHTLPESSSNDVESNANLEDKIINEEDDIWSSFNNIKEDIWSSVNDIKRQQRESKTEKLMKNRRKNDKDKFTENIKPKEDLLNSFTGSEFEGWPACSEVKDEITEEDDVWASTNEILRDIEITMSDVKASKAKIERVCNNKEKSKDENRRPRQSRKRSEEIIGNPDSGKENADVENVDIKKSDKTHSPVSKRRKVSNRKYQDFHQDFDESTFRPSKRSSIDSVKSETNSSSSRGRTTSTSTDEGEDGELKRNSLEKDRKLVRNSHFKQSSKSILLIDPVNPEYLDEKKVPKNKKEGSMSHKRKELYDKKTTATESSVKKSNKPSTILINIFDEKYEKARKDSTSRNQNKK